ncbi:RagB/SusD family nutrient uptake outer membrane protein [Chryseobacterium caseinilyticum]|uniref:RagB/SusD family nutrient uptake outer membrane protein n=1 Tax=Chryseobacterium caseinilyticum TaxID=2771428 RepID=A0ABR8ZHE1_9FLAO|nr:RagB/SusD family nutrient uptake outer membrane protein [Chryseobacterium caseinilyticum]MBD8084280.1 RagB/SusD family nutrient uptake outer membrane protein [Chryseobacterium caseinilyticum]
MFLNSCQDSVELEQPGIITDDVLFTSATNLNSYLVGSVYASMEPSYEMYLTAVLTDEVKPGRGSGGQEFQLHRLFLDNTDPYTRSIWYQNYRVINRVNRLLEGAANFTPPATDVALYNRVIAQARAIRAYSYLQLETYFSPDMANPSALGVIISTSVAESTDRTPRSTNQQVYDVINADLDYARSILTYSSDRYYVDRGFVNAVSARFNLYRGNTVLARQYAQDVITNCGYGLALATPITTASSGAIGSPTWNAAFYATASSFNPYRNMWTDNARGESIFSLNRLVNGVGVAVGTYYNTNASNYSGVNMWNWGRNLFNLFYKDGDIRRYSYVDPSSVVDNNYMTSPDPRNSDVLVVDKYPGKTSTTTRNDLKIFRLSEMYFILAESAVPADLTLAASYVQSVRAARNYLGTATTPVYTSAQVAYADILKERRIELALEGHRYIDLKRLAIKAGVTMDRNQTDDIVTVSNLANGSHKYTLPIPLAEITANPNAQQNPGY